VPSPKEALASDMAAGTPSSSSFSVRTMRMPLPPPPIAALTIIGNPNSSANFLAAATSGTAPEPGITGRPALMAMLRASVLDPNWAMVSAVGPMKTIPLSSHFRANSAFSERKP